MFGSYWYIEGQDGRHYCYAKQPSVECPIGSADLLGDTLELAAIEVGMDPAYLLRKLRHSAGRKRVDGRLTDLCDSCGHKLTKLGFRYWIEAKAHEDDTSVRIASRLGLGEGFTMVEGPWYAKTKKDAQAWARMRVKQTKEAT